MNAPDVAFPASDIPDIIGTALGGGFYSGRIRGSKGLYAVIVSPRAGDLDARPWGSAKYVKSALSHWDGQSNTIAMAKAGSTLAKAVIALDIGGKNDWYLPARDELELVYRHLRPTDYATWAFRNGDNPSSVPPGYPYTPEHPQTTVEAFREGGTEALDQAWYWTSTQYAPDAGFAWFQDFSDGFRNSGLKSSQLRARAVRRVAIR